MSEELTGSGSWVATVTCPEAAEPRTAASVKAGLQDLADRTQYLKDNEVVTQADVEAALALAAGEVVVTSGGGSITTQAKGSAATPSALVERDGSGISALQALRVGAGSPAYATTGDVRAGDTFQIASRNTADSVNRLVVSVDDSDAMAIASSGIGELSMSPSGIMNCVSGGAATFGCTTGACVIATADDASTATMSAGTAGNAVSVACSSSGDAITCTVNGTAALSLSTTAATLGVPLVTWTEGLSPTVQQVIRTGDDAAHELILASQTPSTTSSAANRDAKRVRIQIPSPQGAGAESYVGFEVSGTERAQVNRYSAVFNDGNGGKPVRIGAYYPAGVPGTSYAAIYFGTGATSPNSTTYGFLGDNADTYLNAPTGVLYFMKAGNVHSMLTESGSAYALTIGPSVSLVVTAAAAAATIAANKAQALTLSIGTPTTDVAAKDLTIEPGAGYASATTDANKKGGDLVEQLHAPSASGTVHANESVRWGTSNPPTWDRTVRKVQTIDATPTDIYWAIPDGLVLAGIIRITARRPSNGDAACYFYDAAVDRHSGTAALIGSTSRGVYEDAGAAAWDATIAVSSSNIRTTVTGQAAATIDWTVFYDLTYRAS